MVCLDNFAHCSVCRELKNVENSALDKDSFGNSWSRDLFSYDRRNLSQSRHFIISNYLQVTITAGSMKTAIPQKFSNCASNWNVTHFKPTAVHYRLHLSNALRLYQLLKHVGKKNHCKGLDNWLKQALSPAVQVLLEATPFSLQTLRTSWTDLQYQIQVELTLNLPEPKKKKKKKKKSQFPPKVNPPRINNERVYV
jgi:hypothetical protein